MKRNLPFAVAFCLCAMLCTVPGAGAEEAVSLYRDTWGVPHIYAETLHDAAYAMGYAQAEDRLDDLYVNIRTAVGTLAEVLGKDALGLDQRMRLVENAERCQRYWETDAPPELRALGDSFMAGVRAYLAEHPERQSPLAVELHGWQCLAIGRRMIFNWPLDSIQEEVERKGDAPPFSSNAFAVAPSRSADGTAILMTDPHLTWEGMAVFYEGRMHAAGLDMCGYWLVGTPLPVLGHSAHVAWACTTGGPDTADAYMVKLNPENPLQYQYNGEWKDFESRTATINVRGGDPVTVTNLYSLYGPVWETPDPDKGVAYCGASRYIESMGLLEQSLGMVRAKSCDEFLEALGMFELMEQNISFADTGGNIQYLRNGAVPIRPEGFDWSVPVPGGTDATRWLGFHPVGDLVQVKNPPQGYFQNCNCSPAVMMRDSPMTPDKYRDYIFNVSWDRQSPRGERLLQLLDADSSVTREEAMAYTLDVYDLMSKPWQRALRDAVDAGDAPARTASPEFAKAVADILAWNGEFTKDSIAAPVVKFWRLKCESLIDTAAVADGKPLDAVDRGKMLDALAETLEEMKARYGSLDVKWGDINVIGRGGRFFACDGADFGGGKNRTQTPLVTGVRREPDDSGRFVAHKGSSTILLSFLNRDGVDSYSLVAWGQSADPDSPHHTDQSEKLYAQRKFKPTWFKKEDLLRNLASEKTLTPR
ncbi:MAG: penicillin acylase family protein [Candidatus Hydrogenedentes bacterium]|nr:penicillin acylase family protein [Candidatus Hydrogenedentota bacterium]